MRASRLVSLVLLLQARGPWTAEQLADELEVSVRTIHRDVEALRASGVPIAGERGPAGGYRLPGGHRTRLTGLTGDEVEALFVAAPASPLGLGGLLADAQLKLLAALPPQLRERADRAAQLFHVDHERWFDAPEPAPLLPLVAGALWRGRRLRLRSRGRDQEVDPLGLVAKGPAWYLVATTARGPRSFRVGRLEAAAELEGEAARPDGFELAAHWRAATAAFEASLPLETVRIRIEPAALTPLRRLVDSRRRELLPRDGEQAARADDVVTLPDGRLELDVWFERLDHAETLLALGGACEVVAPAALRERMAAQARALAARYRD